MLTNVIPDGSWTDVTPLPDGGVAIAILRPGETVSHATVEVTRATAQGMGELLWTCKVDPPASTMHFLRAAADGLGRVAIVGQGKDGGFWVSREGQPLEYLGQTFGVFCVEVAGLPAGGWSLAVFRPGRYELLTLPVSGPPTVDSTVASDSTQGFLQIDGGIIRLQDVERKSIPRLVLPEFAGKYAVGQNADGTTDCVRITDDETRYAALVADYAQPPHAIVALDGTLWVCSWLKSGAWVAGYAPSDIPWGNETGSAPPEPVPVPPSEAAPPAVTIAAYAPESGEAPLSVRAVAKVVTSSGPVESLQWRFRAATGGAWTLDAVNPAADLDHTFVFKVAGEYNLSLRATGPGGSDETANPRLVTVTGVPVPPEPPKPEPGPTPSPRPEGDTVSLKCWDQQFVWCAEEGGGTEGDGCGIATATRTEVHAWETFRSIVAADGRVGFQAPNGAWLCAEANGELWFNRAKEPEFQPTAWEAFWVEPGLSGGTSLKTDHGTYVQAEGGGGGRLIHAPRVEQHSEAAETFFPSRPLIPGVATGGEVYAGGLKQHGNEYYKDANGPVLPVFCHYGDGLSKYVRDQNHVRHNLDAMRARGYGGVRTWSTLGGDYWSGRQVGPAHQGEEVLAVGDSLLRGVESPRPDVVSLAGRLLSAVHWIGLARVLPPAGPDRPAVRGADWTLRSRQ